jgi:hypothetical protein
MYKVSKFIIGFSFAAVFSVSHADVATINKYYKNNNLASKVQRCKGDQNCNTFYALSKQWKSIPKCLKTSYGPDCETKKQAQDGDGYGLWKGGYFESTYHLAEAGEAVFYKGGSASKADERIFAQGLAVLYYLESKSGNR